MARQSNPTDGFGAPLRMYRRALRLTLAPLAELTGLTSSCLSRLENNAVAVPPLESPEAFHTLAKMSPKDRRAFARTQRTPRKATASKRGKDPERPLGPEEVKRLVRKLKY